MTKYTKIIALLIITILPNYIHAQDNELLGGWVMEGWCGFEGGAIWFEGNTLEYSYFTDTGPIEDKLFRKAGTYKTFGSVIVVTLQDSTIITLYKLVINGRIYLSHKKVEDILLGGTDLDWSLNFMFTHRPLFKKEQPYELRCIE